MPLIYIRPAERKVVGEIRSRTIATLKDWRNRNGDSDGKPVDTPCYYCTEKDVGCHYCIHSTGWTIFEGFEDE